MVDRNMAAGKGGTRAAPDMKGIGVGFAEGLAKWVSQVVTIG